MRKRPQRALRRIARTERRPAPKSARPSGAASSQRSRQSVAGVSRDLNETRPVDLRARGAMTNPRRLGHPAEPAPRPHVENRLRPNECEIAAAPCRSQARARRRAHGRHQRLRTQLLVRALGRAEPLVMVTRHRVVGRSRPPDRLSAMRREADRPIRLWNDVPQRVRPASTARIAPKAEPAAPKSGERRAPLACHLGIRGQRSAPKLGHCSARPWRARSCRRAHPLGMLLRDLATIVDVSLALPCFSPRSRRSSSSN